MTTAVLAREKLSRHATRVLLWALVGHDLRGRFAGSAMGFFWTVIHPLVLLLLYLYVFDRILQVRARIGATGDPQSYALFMCSGMIPWLMFQESLHRCTGCIPQNAHLIKNVRFPSAVLPTAYCLSNAVQGLIGLCLLCAALALLGRPPGTAALWLPVVFACQIAFTIGLGKILAVVQVYVRDTSPFVALGLLLWMFLSPVFYDVGVVQDHVPDLYPVVILGNPWHYLLEGYRLPLLEGRAPETLTLVAISALALLSLALGRVVFDRHAPVFGDLV